MESGLAVIGTPDDAVKQLKRLKDQSGGFGTFLHMAHNWADWSQTKRSYELFARYVIPKFQGINDNRRTSYRWAADHQGESMPRVEQAINNETEADEREKATRAPKASTGESDTIPD